MNDKISYFPLEADMKEIMKLIKEERYRSLDTFIDRAIQLLLTWESKNPQRCMDIMKTMTPFTPEQEAFMNQTLNPEEKEKHFGKEDYMTDALKETQEQQIYSPDSDDYIKLRNNLTISKKYVRKLQIVKPSENEIMYDGYPILFRFYSRFLPAKIVILTLGELLRENNSLKVDLNTLRLKAYDIAEEISTELQKYEDDNNIKRNEKISTGFPKIDFELDSIERKARIQKRFKDQYVGKLRKNRQTQKQNFEGALIALDLIYVTKEDEKLYISLTEKGREFYLLENPVINGDYSKPLSNEEEKFIYEKLLPRLELEYEFIKTALKVINNYQRSSTEKKITDVLDEEFYNALRIWNKENPEKAKIYENEDSGPKMDEYWNKYIVGWRVATMGRMAELSLVNWGIDETGNSTFNIPEELEIKI